jgi:subtilisin family serine protease
MPGSDKFCDECGAKQPEGGPNRRRRKKRAALVGIVAFLLCGLVGVVAVSGGWRGSGAPRVGRLNGQQMSLLAQTNPRTTCPDSSGPSNTAGPGGVAVEIATVRDGCLLFSYEDVPVAQLETRIATLRRDPQVGAVSPMLLQAVPDSDDRPWPLQQLAPLPLGRTAWPDGRGVSVAVLDSGVDARQGRFAGGVERWSFTGDRGGDGEEAGHGTAVAGIIAASTRSGDVVEGLAPRAHILDVPVFATPGLAEGGLTLAASVRWATDHGADVINMSVGLSPFTQSVGAESELGKLARRFIDGSCRDQEADRHGRVLLGLRSEARGRIGRVRW